MIRILHVDDCPEDLELTKQRLMRTGRGLQIEWAESGEQALSALEKKRYDCILCDYQMPEMDGFQILNTLRGKGESTPFIFLTGQGNEEIAAEALRAGADDYFTKEVGFAHYNRLIHSIRRLVDSKALRDDRSRAEQALRESEEKFRNLVESSTDGIAIVQGNEIKFVNQALLNMFLCQDVSDMEGHNFVEFIAPPFREIMIERGKTRERKEDVTEQYEFRALRHHGTEFDAEISVRLITYMGKAARQGIIRDVTERKRAEEALRESEQRYRSFISQANEGIFRFELEKPMPTEIPVDEQIEFLYKYAYLAECNQALAKTYGASSPDDLIGKKLSEFHGGADNPVNIEALREFIASNYLIVGAETQERDKDNNILYFSNNSTGIVEENHLIRMWGTQTDITKRKQAEEKLKLLSSAVEQSTEGLAVCDLNGNLQFVNNFLASMHGYTPDELGGEHVSIFHSPEQMPSVEQSIRQIKKTGEFNGKIWHVRRDGTAFPTLMQCSLLRDETGNPTGIVGTARDITQRNWAEEALRESEEKYRSLFENSIEGIGVSRGNRVVSANKALLDIYGYDNLEEFIKIPLLGHIAPENKKLVAERIKMKEKRGYVEPRYELKITCKDGKIKDTEISTSEIIIENKKYTQSTFRDITERKRAEEELRKSHEQLERRTKELEDINKELEAFSYSVSHDLRAPLRHIEGYSTALLEVCEGISDKEPKYYLGKIINSNRRAGQLVADLLRLSQLSRGELHIEPVELSSLARRIADELQNSEPERKVCFKIAEELVAKADARLIQVALENLLGNAWKFTQKKKKAEIEFGVTEHEGRRVFFVKDNGAGFDAADAHKLFAPFQRLHTDEEFEGSGTGLATVQRIIHRHGGRVWAEGRKGKGATFYFALG